MASIHFRRHLIHNCIIDAGSQAFGSATGEGSIAYTSRGTSICRFVQQRERYARESIGFPVESQDLILFDDNVTIDTLDRVRDITFRNGGGTVDAGPFDVDAVLERNETPGAHHISVRVERIE